MRMISKVRYFYGPYDSQRCKKFGLKREQEKCMTFIEEQLEEDGIQWRGIADCILDKNGELYKMVLEQIKKEKENGLSLLSKRGNKAQSTPKNALVSTRKISSFKYTK